MGAMHNILYHFILIARKNNIIYIIAGTMVRGGNYDNGVCFLNFTAKLPLLIGVHDTTCGAKILSRTH